MAYVAVKGGTEAISASLDLWKLEHFQGGAGPLPEQIKGGLRLLVDQVQSEASLWAPDIAARALWQADGSPEEAVFLLRAFRSTIPRLYCTAVLSPSDLFVKRRISAAFKDIPGGQILGPTCDYSHRLIDFGDHQDTVQAILDRLKEKSGLNQDETSTGQLPKVVDYLRREGLLVEPDAGDPEPVDITKQSVTFPARRSERLQVLSRGQTGAVTALGYASLRGYGALHPTVGELRVGNLPLTAAYPGGPSSDPEEDIYFGEITVTEVETLVPVEESRHDFSDLRFELGYGFCFGQNETKAIAMSLLDQCLETGDKRYPTHDEEFVLLHVDSVEATGFISHLKLPHYVTFQSKLESLRVGRGTKSHD